MKKVIDISDAMKSQQWQAKRLETIKQELIKYYNIDLDKLLAQEPVINLSIEEFEELTEDVIETIDKFCEIHQNVTIQDIFFVLDNVREIIRENAEIME